MLFLFPLIISMGGGVLIINNNKQWIEEKQGRDGLKSLKMGIPIL